jgi:hypothetical protein
MASANFLTARLHPNLNSEMGASVFRVLCYLRLRIKFFSDNTSCPRCQNLLDVFAYHAAICRKNGSTPKRLSNYWRHNQIVNVIVRILRNAGYDVQTNDISITHNNNHPDALVNEWGKDQLKASLDVKCYSQMAPSYKGRHFDDDYDQIIPTQPSQEESGEEEESMGDEETKDDTTQHPLQPLNPEDTRHFLGKVYKKVMNSDYGKAYRIVPKSIFIPLVFDIFGNYHRQVDLFISKVAKAHSRKSGYSTSSAEHFIRQQILCELQRAVALMIIDRVYPPEDEYITEDCFIMIDEVFD